VGFIRDLPRDLAQAFRATLEELAEADLLLHLVDAADPDAEMQIAAVETILRDLELAETPRLLVMNKVDLLAPEDRARLPALAGALPAIAVSAVEPESTRPLLVAVENMLWHEGRLPRSTEIGIGTT
jgi:GTP-binding protein HflX